uniref:FAS1 domain-containing protein n=1 Tax=Chlamydomonas leiostraca TaxID=1034604 RepID=A0A7S0RF88_9CHLO|mmetsp:Transcript_21117/g.53663  ORF Transcript_21117/g.53663 Transcript_21117/m.53663 type:complete len:676 (+) Transcript_21117:139-2166(+)
MRAEGMAAKLLCGLVLVLALGASHAQTDLLAAARSRGLTSFLDAVQAAGLGSALANRSLTATVFVPTNAAFGEALRTLNLQSLAQLAQVPGLLAATLQHHVVPNSAVKASDLKGHSPLTTLLTGQKLAAQADCFCLGRLCFTWSLISRLTCDYSVTSAGGTHAAITTRDVRIGNVYLHIVDKVLLPNVTQLGPAPSPAPTPSPSGGYATLADALAAIPELGFLRQSADLVGLTKAGALLADANTNVTLFAPTTQAFTRFLAGANLNPLTLLVSGTDIIAATLRYHVAKDGGLRADQLSNGQSLATLLSGRSLSVQVDGTGVSIRGDLSTGMVTRANIVAGKSVIHIVDEVLVPNIAPNAAASPPPSPSPATPTFASVAAAATAYPQLSSLLAAVQAANLTSTLSDPNLVATVFAPTNSAFDALLAALNTTLAGLAADKEGLAATLMYHLVPGVAARSTQLTNQQSLPTLLAGRNLTVSLPGGGAVRIISQLTTAKVTAANVSAGKAIVHIVDTVLLPDPALPPYTSFAAAAGNARGFSTLSAALKATGLDAALSDPTLPYTLLAPTDAAFTALLSALGRTPEQLLADTPLVTRVLSLHVLPQVANARELVTRAAAGGASARLTTMLFGRLLTVSRVPGSTTLRFNSSATTSARVVAADLVAGAGLVHTIDAVLLP